MMYRNSFFNFCFFLIVMVPSFMVPMLREDVEVNERIGNGTNEAHTITLYDGKKFDIYIVDVETTDIQFFHKNKQGAKISTINNLKSQLAKEKQKLLFATNGGMFKPDLTPTGLYVEDGKMAYPLNEKQGGATFTNFYSLQPNGVFYIQKNNQFGIVPKEAYKQIENVKYATQSGPMLIVDGKVNDIFAKASKSKFIRSGVGITSRGRLMFAISQEPVTFYDFHRIFKYYKCSNALYLDGAVSEMYLPELKRVDTFNDFALIIAVSEK